MFNVQPPSPEAMELAGSFFTFVSVFSVAGITVIIGIIVARLIAGPLR